jgi:hypothetical protein
MKNACFKRNNQQHVQFLSTSTSNAAGNIFNFCAMNPFIVKKKIIIYVEFYDTSEVRYHALFLI